MRRTIIRPNCGRDRPHQRPHLRDRQQRRLSLGLCDNAGAYEEAARAVFATLDRLEERLSRQRYLVGRQITEADWRLFTTLVRFEPSITGISNAICGESSIIQISGIICANFTRCPVSPRPSAWITSSGTITEPPERQSDRYRADRTAPRFHAAARSRPFSLNKKEMGRAQNGATCPYLRTRITTRNRGRNL